MKKICIALGLVLGLCASTASRGWSQGLIPWHIDTYDVTSTTGAFIDISTNPNAVALGADMEPMTDLLNTTFARTLVYDTAYVKNAAGEDSVTPSGNKIVDVITSHFSDKVTKHKVASAIMITETNRIAAGFPLGFEFDLCGQKMTHFTVSAWGGIFLRNDSLQPEYPTYLTSVGRWGIFAQPYLSKSATAAPTMASSANFVVSPTTGAPAYYLIEGEAGQKVLTVQHHYLVRGAATGPTDEWTFQFKFYEATGKIEFIVKELEYANALSGNHRIAISVTNYTTYPTLDANGNDFKPADPYKAQLNTYLNITPKGGNHRIFVGQSDAMSEAKGWDTVATWGANTNPPTMRIDANHHPEPGHTIAFTPKEAPATADITPFDADYYNVTDQTATATTYNAKIYYNADKFTQQSFHEAGPIVAVISESETPDYTLENGVLYAKGDKLTSTSGSFQPEVIAVSQSKISSSLTLWGDNNTVKLPSTNFQVNLSATGLEKSHVYHIHVYRMAYAGTTAPAYSALCHTITFTTDFPEPKQFTQVGLADIDKVRLKAEPADGLSVLIVKSKDLNVKPTGQLKKGDKIGDAEVLELLDAEKEWDLPLEYGEGCFIVAFSTNTTDPDHYIYAPTKHYFSVGTAYKELPGLIDFSGCAFGVPNFEYDGINTKTQDYAQNLEPKIARDLPFGYTRTPYTDGTLKRVFGLGKPGKNTPVTVYAFVVPDVDFITPPIVADKNRILATFNANWVAFDDFGGSYDNYAFASSANSSDICSIEYSIDGGEWRTGVTYKGYDEVFTQRDDNGYYNVSFSLIADETSGESFIGKKIRFRFVSKTTMVGGMGSAYYLIVPSIDIKEDKICLAPSAVRTVEADMSSNQIALKWTDNNTQQGVTFNIAYKMADDPTDNWLPKKANETNGIVTGLSPFTQYAFQLTADCGSYGTSYPSKTFKFYTTHAFPYAESMAQDTGHYELIGGSNAYIPGPDPFSRGINAASGNLPETGAANLTINNGERAPFNIYSGWQYLVEHRKCPQSIAVRETSRNAWLLTAPVFIKEYEEDYTQVIRFKANSAYTTSTTWTKGSLGTAYNNCKLYILISHNGAFTMADTIATIAVGTETIEDVAYEFEVPATLAQEKFAQVAFFFDNPDAQTGNAEYTNCMLFEIYDFAFTYADNVCIPLGNLVRTNTTADGASFEWEGYSDHYKFYWGLSEDNYTNVVSTTETSYTLTGLKDATRYYVKVEGYCNAEETEIAPNTQTDWFRTFEACHVPTDFAVADITSSGAMFSSTNKQDIMTKRLIYLTPEGGETLVIVQPNDKDNLVVDNLLDKTSYVAMTRSFCGTDSSELSEPITFTTLAVMYNIALNILPDEEAGTVKGAGSYEKGESVTITATPAASYLFVAWQTENGVKVSEDATYTFIATANVTYTALFVENPDAKTYTVTLNILPNENAGTVVGAGSWLEGKNVAIKATPNEGYTFVAWLNGTDTLSKETTYIFKAVADVTYTALFKANETANEQELKAAFNVATGNGHLYIENLKGLTIEEVTVYGLTGRKLGHFTPNSREDLALPINAERALLLVRVASEQGVAIYKVYLH